MGLNEGSHHCHHQGKHGADYGGHATLAPPSPSKPYFCPMCPGVESDDSGDCPGDNFRLAGLDDDRGRGYAPHRGRYTRVALAHGWRMGAYALRQRANNVPGSIVPELLFSDDVDATDA
jgi:hypothetical protein